MIKKLAAFCVFVFSCMLLCLLGCEGDPGYVSDTIEKKRYAQRETLLITGKQALQIHYTIHQKWPESLDEVEGMPKLPSPLAWIYNNKTGMLTIGEEN